MTVTPSGEHTERQDDPWEIDLADHPGRTNSPTYVEARKVMIQAVQKAQPWFYGDRPYQDHHGGGIWLRDGSGWFMTRGMAGIEWSTQFIAAAPKVEILRVCAQRIIAGFPRTYDGYIDELGMSQDHLEILSTPIVTDEDIAHWTDSFWNASVPLPAGVHVGVISSAHDQLGGVHYYPTPITDIELFKRDDFQLWVPATSEPGSRSIAVGPTGYGEKSVQVLHDPAGIFPDALRHGADAMVFAPYHPVAKLAFGET